jgi:hypothetical protein
MKLKDFLINYSKPNHNPIRLLYTKENGAYEIVTDSWEDVSTDDEIVTGRGIYKDYLEAEVVGIVAPFVDCINTEAINIVIQRNDSTKI